MPRDVENPILQRLGKGVHIYGPDRVNPHSTTPLIRLPVWTLNRLWYSLASSAVEAQPFFPADHRKCGVQHVQVRDLDIPIDVVFRAIGKRYDLLDVGIYTGVANRNANLTSQGAIAIQRHVHPDIDEGNLLHQQEVEITFFAFGSSMARKTKLMSRSSANCSALTW